LHTVGLYQTHDDLVQEARQYFAANPNAFDGQFVDPDSSTNAQSLGAFKAVVDQAKQNAANGISPWPEDRWLPQSL
jgi:predicted outer membrane protein